MTASNAQANERAPSIFRLTKAQLHPIVDNLADEAVARSTSASSTTWWDTTG